MLSNRILGSPGFLSFRAAALPTGSFIGATAPAGNEWRGEEIALNSCVSAGGVFCSGEFVGGINYLGVEFDISGQTHYGWVEIESSPIGTRAWIHRWAYETEPGVGIIAGIPEPSAMLLVLFGGALGLSRRRPEGAG